ncbi:MAG: Cys-tRNA(Pro) deacylase [Lachnospiraceae bacterium]|nr:Cys-tRNA(Pro) deacylase [Lachnospiraceae bacterium]
MAKKEKEIKTNAMRILDKHKIAYEVLQYECDGFIDGIHTAQKTGAPPEQSFKTLVLQGKSRQYYVFVLPVAKEVDLKGAARLAGEKSVEMIPVKEITQVTGYVRGGCSPLGMKKGYPVFLSENALQYEKLYISGGRIGTTLCLGTEDFQKVTGAKTGVFTSK